MQEEATSFWLVVEHDVLVEYQISGEREGEVWHTLVVLSILCMSCTLTKLLFGVWLAVAGVGVVSPARILCLFSRMMEFWSMRCCVVDSV